MAKPSPSRMSDGRWMPPAFRVMATEQVSASMLWSRRQSYYNDSRWDTMPKPRRPIVMGPAINAESKSAVYRFHFTVKGDKIKRVS